MKTVLGFIVILLFALAGIFMIMAGKTLLGVMFMVLGAANAVILTWFNRMNRKK